MNTSSETASRPIDVVVTTFILSVHAVAVALMLSPILFLVDLPVARDVMPYVFSWGALVAFAVLVPMTGMVGITVGYHRLLTHDGFQTPTWAKWLIGSVGLAALQGSASEWIAHHRMHHRFSDQEGDPHSPRDGWLWSHIGWLFVYFSSKEKEEEIQKYAPDLMADPFFAITHRYYWFVPIVTALAIGALGYSYDGWTGVTSFLLWGFFLRVVVVWNVTWFVNSASHTWGYRNYETRDNSRNLWWVGILAFGEGWHNNHHAYPRCARHGHKWWEIDVSYWFICFLWLLGLAKRILSEPDKKTAS